MASAILKVRVEEARDLIHRRFWGTRPYATVVFDGKKVSTSVLKRNPNPKWRALFSFKVAGDVSNLTLTLNVWDKGPFRFDDVLLGRAIIPLNMLEEDEASGSRKLDRWFTLQHGESGSVHMALELTDVAKEMASEWVLLESEEGMPTSSTSTIVAIDEETPGIPPSPASPDQPPSEKRAEPSSLPRSPLFNPAEELLANEGKCMSCGGPLELGHMHVFEECFHYFCRECIQSHAHSVVEQRQSDPTCPREECNTPFPQYILRRFLPRDAFEAYIERMLQEAISSSQDMIHCPNAACSAVIEKIMDSAASSAPLDSSTLPGGIRMSTEALEHLNVHRFRCRECMLEFCSLCMVTPYHLGFDCEQYKNYLMSRHCRFCNAPLPPRLDGEGASSTSSSEVVPITLALQDVCESDDCQAKKLLACSETHPCGHHCGGIAGDTEAGKHLPCLHANCIPDGAAQSQEEFCNICWIDDIGSAPSIQLECGHVFHYQCVLDKLQQKWPSARVTFNFWNCPLCNQRMEHPGLHDAMRPLLALCEDIETRAMKRLKYEGLDKADDITEKSGKFYRDPLGYAMSRFAYYICNKCHKPYFGGQVSCNIDQQDGGFSSEDLECGSCSGIAIEECPRHGKEFIQHKCQYCCSVASWFCWGKVHFCEKCHTRQVKGDYVSRYPISKLPKCPGVDRCALGIDHPPNGTHYSLGCTLCKKAKEF